MPNLAEQWDAPHKSATTTLDATELLAMRIRLPDRTVMAETAAKPLRKAQAAIRDAGADNIALVLRGRLIAGDVVAEAGVSAQPKAAESPRRPARKRRDHQRRKTLPPTSAVQP